MNNCYFQTVSLLFLFENPIVLDFYSTRLLEGKELVMAGCEQASPMSPQAASTSLTHLLDHSTSYCIYITLVLYMQSVASVFYRHGCSDTTF